MQVQLRHAGGVGAAVIDGRIIELERVLVDAHPPARITSGRVTGASSDSQSVRGAAAPSGPPSGAPTICVGYVVVDFICMRAVEGLSEGDAFVALGLRAWGVA